MHVPACPDLPWLRADSQAGANGVWRLGIRCEAAAMYRTAVCDSNNNEPTLWRMRYVLDKTEMVLYASSAPGAPAYFSVPPSGGIIESRLTADAVSAARPNPWSGESETLPSTVRVSVVESDGLLDAAMPPTLVFSGDGVTVAATGFTDLAVPSGLYTVERGSVTQVGGGVFSAVALQGNTGVPYTGTTGLDVPVGSPIVAAGGVIRLSYTVSASLTADIAIVLRRDERNYLASTLVGPL